MSSEALASSEVVVLVPLPQTFQAHLPQLLMVPPAQVALVDLAILAALASLMFQVCFQTLAPLVSQPVESLAEVSALNLALK